MKDVPITPGNSKGLGALCQEPGQDQVYFYYTTHSISMVGAYEDYMLPYSRTDCTIVLCICTLAWLGRGG